MTGIGRGADRSNPLRRFLRTETASAGLVMAAVVVAVVWANTATVGYAGFIMWRTVLPFEHLRVRHATAETTRPRGDPLLLDGVTEEAVTLRSVEPTGSGVVRRRRGAVERNGGIGCVPPNQVDHSLEELDLIVGVPQAAADGHALPRMGSQRVPHDGFHVVTSIKADEAGLDAHRMVGELRQSLLDRLGDRRRIPRSGHPIRVKPDDQDAG